ncbi:hypothetical protein ACP6PL_19150 [Dapis sp. BLCC M126]|uniref:hypothetical protein n=1 Tax=Dapis sp. BLCC M126 TaxID=3400189 RepID=UPI003CE8DA7C
MLQLKSLYRGDRLLENLLAGLDDQLLAVGASCSRPLFLTIKAIACERLLRGC